MAAKTYDATINAKNQSQGPDDMVIAGTLNIDSSAGGKIYIGGVDQTSAIGGAAPLASPTFTGTPAAPTASVGTNTTQIATTAFAMAVVGPPGEPTTATFSPAAGGTDETLVTITVKDRAGNAVTGPVVFDVLLSDASSGAGLTATTADGAVAAGASGVDLATLVSKKALRVQTTAAGVYILSITDSAKTGFRVVAQLPGRKAVVSSALVSGNYG